MLAATLQPAAAMAETPQTNIEPSPSMFSLSKRASKLAALRADTSLYYFPGMCHHSNMNCTHYITPAAANTSSCNAGVMKALGGTLWCVRVAQCDAEMISSSTFYIWRKQTRCPGSSWPVTRRACVGQHGKHANADCHSTGQNKVPTATASWRWPKTDRQWTFSR